MRVECAKCGADEHFFRRKIPGTFNVPARHAARNAGWRSVLVGTNEVWTCRDCHRKRELEETTGMTADERAWLG